jgi:hypothetical protein
MDPYRSCSVAILIVRHHLQPGHRANDRDEGDAVARRATEVVGQPQRPVTVDLALARLAVQLQPALEQHPQPGRPGRVTVLLP